MYDTDIQIRHHVFWIITIMSILFQPNKNACFYTPPPLLLYIAFVLEDNLITVSKVLIISLPLIKYWSLHKNSQEKIQMQIFLNWKHTLYINICFNRCFKPMIPVNLSIKKIHFRQNTNTLFKQKKNKCIIISRYW